MKITIVRECEIEAVSLRNAWLISRAWRTRLHVAHLTFKLGARHERGNRVDHQHVDRTGAHKRVGDFKRLFAGIRLGNQKVVDIHAKLAGIDRIKSMLGIDEGADATLLLGFRDGVKRKRGLAGRFRTINFDHPATRQAADTKSNVEPQRARGNSLNIHGLVVLAELHDGALAELTLDLAQRS